MNYKPYPEQYWIDISKTIENLSKSNQPLYAAFDADGTLWDTDLGENFFQYQIDHQLVSLPSNPWNYYLEMKKVNNDPRSAYLWLAQINVGQNLSTIRKWSQSAFEEIKPNPIFLEQKKLMDLFIQNNIKVFIVTASVKWAVEPGALALGLQPDSVIGVETVVKDNIITASAIEPITYKGGKVEALLKKTQGVKPFFSCGNTMGDFELIKASTHFHLCVSAASFDDKLYRTEHELQVEAEKNNWWKHRFI